MVRGAMPSCATVLVEGGHGSGFFVSEDGLFITAQHVVEGSSIIKIKLHNGPILTAELLRADAALDVALLRVTGAGYTPLPLAAEEPEVGEDVFAIGTPTDVELGQSVSRGIVSGRRRIDETVFLQTDASVSPGNSGGPLLDAQGRVVGVVQRKVVAQGAEGIGFALPTARVLQALNVTVR